MDERQLSQVEGEVPAAPLAAQLARLAECVPEIQEGLDDHYLLQLTRIVQQLNERGLAPHPAIADLVMPHRQLVDRFDVELNFLCMIERWRSSDVNLDLLGIPVHSLLAQRFGLTEERWDWIKLTVERVSLPAGSEPATQSEEN